MEESLWKFTDNQGTFVSETADQINTLYFPLCNSAPIMSSLSPDLHGDIKTNFHSFLLQPVSRIDLGNLKSSRNFWIYINPQKIWSATGVSKDMRTLKDDKFTLEAGLLWQKINRQNKKIGLRAQISSFVPADDEPVEIMRIDITNISSKSIKFIPAAAIPIYGRSCHNLHDHRHVTSLLIRIRKEKFGVVVEPTLSFDETGHKKNTTSYFVFGVDNKSQAPEYIYPTQEEFCGDNSDLAAPSVIFNNLLPDGKRNIQGKEPMAGLRFKTKVLKPKEACSYIILMGIVNDKAKISAIFNKFNTRAKVEESLTANKEYWQKKSAQISLHTEDDDFDNWLRWVNIQPTLRKIFGCSFLPDFDYGKGGRGWRDLWQDCLALILTHPKEVRPLLINNFKGVRIDGSNATIIGEKPGEFIADRNNISRVWMDHAAWPLFTLLLYIHQNGDLKILLEKATYFKDHQLCRGQEIDLLWRPEYGKELKNNAKKVYRGTILEHILIQNLVQFFNVGPHNHIRLENADWNDGLDMAGEHGESVAFSCLYAQNLRNLADLLKRSGLKKIFVLEELAILLNSLRQTQIDYSSVNKKRKILQQYFQAVKYTISGKKLAIATPELIADLKKKADWMSEHIQKTEWLKTGFFNGYYDNHKKMIEGKINGRIQMTLTGQTFPIMSGMATQEQIKTIFKNCNKYLKDKKLGGFHLNTDFKQEQLNLGRAFSFVYGDKENGAFFNHMAVMFAYALYTRGFAREGYEVINSIYEMARDTQKSKIYPCLPEYFNAQGRGMYSYLTGSASWFILNLLTQVFGIRGEYGDFIIAPKLTADQFKKRNTISITTSFAERTIAVKFTNPHKKEFGDYSIQQVKFNARVIASGIMQSRFCIPRQEFLSLAKNCLNTIELSLY